MPRSFNGSLSPRSYQTPSVDYITGHSCTRRTPSELNPPPPEHLPPWVLVLKPVSTVEGEASRGRADVLENENPEGVYRDTKSSRDGGQQDAGEHREVQVDGKANVAGPAQYTIDTANAGEGARVSLALVI